MLEFLNTIAPFVQMASGVMGQRKNDKIIRQSNVATAGETQANELYKALLDPNSPILRGLSDEARKRALEDFQSQIRTMQGADRRSVSMGRTPTFFNPERADEAVSFLTSRGMPQLGALADQHARNRIIEAATGFRQAVPQEVARQTLGRQNAVSNSTYQAGIPNQIIDLLRGMSNQGRTVTNPQSRDMGPINWNQQLPSIYRG